MKQFTKKQTNMCKGVAICIMLFHHLFFSQESWPLYYYKIQMGSTPLIGFIAKQGKICVAIFVLLSAYGLTFSINRNIQKSIGAGQSLIKSYFSFVERHVLSLYKLYWPVFVPAMIIGLVSNISSPVNIYRSFGECLRDFFGIAYILDGETPFNGAWWYISFAITLYFVFPFLHKAMKKYPKILLLFSFLIGLNPTAKVPILLEWKRYAFIGCLGIYLAENNILNRLINWKSNRIRIILSGFICAIFFAVRCIKPFTFDGALAVGIVVLSVSLFDSVKYLSAALNSLGKYSGTMFLLHGLLYKNFVRDFIYGFEYPILIFIALLLITYVGSVAIQNLAQYIYNYIGIKKGIVNNAS